MQNSPVVRMRKQKPTMSTPIRFYLDIISNEIRATSRLQNASRSLPVYARFLYQME